MEDFQTTNDFEKDMTGFSILWINNERRSDYFKIDDDAYHDLNLDRIINSISLDPKKKELIKTVFSRLPTNPDIINFRLSILEDFINIPDIIECLNRVMPNLEVMSGFNDYLLSNSDERILLHDVAWRLYVLDNYITCIIQFNDLYTRIKEKIKSDGLKHFFGYVEYVVNTGTFVSCKNELPALIEHIANIKSITVGINLDFKMSPVEATLISINDKKIEKQNIFHRLFSGETLKAKSEMYSLYSKGILGNVDYNNPGTIKNINIKLTHFFDELSGMLYGVIKPIEGELKRFSGIKTRLLGRLKPEFQYYMDITSFLKEIIGTGLPVCKPEIIDMKNRLISVRDGYNINLALRFMDEKTSDINDKIVKNDIDIGEQGRILIITGPNMALCSGNFSPIKRFRCNSYAFSDRRKTGKA